MFSLKKTFDNESINYEVDTAFEIISSYVVGIFYNNLYHVACDEYKNGSYKSITDAYNAKVNLFVQALISKPIKSGPFTSTEPYAHFKKIIKGLHTYYVIYTKRDITLNEYLGKLISYIVPEEKYKSIRSIDGDRLLYKILTDSIREFSIEILKKYTKIIIDERLTDYDEEFLRPIQDSYKSILYMKRKEIFLYFIESSATDKDDVLNKCKEQFGQILQRELNEKHQLKSQIKDHILFEKKLKEQVLLRDEEIKELKEQVLLRDEEIKELKEQQRKPDNYDNDNEEIDSSFDNIEAVETDDEEMNLADIKKMCE